MDEAEQIQLIAKPALCCLGTVTYSFPLLLFGERRRLSCSQRLTCVPTETWWKVWTVRTSSIKRCWHMDLFPPCLTECGSSFQSVRQEDIIKHLISMGGSLLQYTVLCAAATAPHCVRLHFTGPSYTVRQHHWSRDEVSSKVLPHRLLFWN